MSAVQQTTFTGPVISKKGFQVGASTTPIVFYEKSTVSVIVPAVSASATQDISVALADVLVGDQCLVSPPLAAMESGLVVGAAWCDTAGTLKIRIGNLKTAAALTGSTSAWTYTLIR